MVSYLIKVSMLITMDGKLRDDSNQYNNSYPTHHNMGRIHLYTK